MPNLIPKRYLEVWYDRCTCGKMKRKISKLCWSCHKESYKKMLNKRRNEILDDLKLRKYKLNYLAYKYKTAQPNLSSLYKQAFGIRYRQIKYEKD